MSGFPDAGTIRHMQAPIGVIHTTTITRMAGICMRATGIGMITGTITTTITMILTTITDSF
jgi:hypothetical protein